MLPSSTGVIGWHLPVREIVGSLPAEVQSQQSATMLPTAQGICTTDRFPKIRRFDGVSRDGRPFTVVVIAIGASSPL